jgi:sporulation protein YlmC with PRC-barrel domain
MQTKRRLLSASTISGDKVRNTSGEDLGKIEDLMVDLDHARIAYAVLSFGGVLGMGGKLFAIPLEALALDADAHEFVLNVPRETLENAPGFDKNDWPDASDLDWQASIYSHYGYAPYWNR